MSRSTGLIVLGFFIKFQNIQKFDDDLKKNNEKIISKKIEITRRLTMFGDIKMSNYDRSGFKNYTCEKDFS